MVFFGKLYESVKSAVKSAFGYNAPVAKTDSYSRVTAPVYSRASVNGNGYNGNGNGNGHSTPLYSSKPNVNRLDRKAKYGDGFALGLAKQIIGKFGSDGNSMDQFETVLDNVALYARDERLDSDYSLKVISRALDMRAKQISEYLQKVDNYTGDKVKPNTERMTRLNKKIITMSSLSQARKRQIEGGWTDMTLDDYLAWEIREKSDAFASGGTTNSCDRITGKSYENFVDSTKFNVKESGRVIKFKERVYNPEDVAYATKFGTVYESGLRSIRDGSVRALQAEIQRSEIAARRVRNLEMLAAAA